MKFSTYKNQSHLNRRRMTDLCWRILASYLMAAGVGLGRSQYQWIVSSVTSLAQVLSSDLVLAKILSRKLNSSRSTCGHRQTAKKKTVKSVEEIINNNGYLKRSHTRTRYILDGGNMPYVVSMGMCFVSPG